jgi:integrase
LHFPPQIGQVSTERRSPRPVPYDARFDGNVARPVRHQPRQPTVPIPSRVLAHLRRWHRIDPEAKHFVEFNGRPVSSVKTAFKSAVRLAGLDSGASPHTLRHTAATWLMQRGADPWQAAGYLGMSLEVLLNTYGHHHPDYLSDAVEKIVQRNPAAERKRDVSGAITGAVIKLPTGKR